MARRTKKVGISGKWGTRYGSSLRKQAKKMEISQRVKYDCPLCGKASVKREAVGIWICKGCKRTFSGGAWQLHTAAAFTARGTIARLRKQQKGTVA